MACYTSRAESGILPVCTLTQRINLALRKILILAQRRIGVVERIVAELRKLARIKHVNLLAKALHADASVINNLCLLVKTAVLRRNDNNSVSTSRTIDCRSRGIFQNIYRLNVAGIELRECLAINRESVDDIERLVSALNRTASAHSYAYASARRTRCWSNLNAGNASCQSRVERRCGDALHLSQFYRRNGSRKVAFLLLTVANNHNLVDEAIVLLKLDFYGVRVVVHIHINTSVANKLDVQRKRKFFFCR